MSQQDSQKELLRYYKMLTQVLAICLFVLFNTVLFTELSDTAELILSIFGAVLLISMLIILKKWLREIETMLEK